MPKSSMSKFVFPFYYLFFSRLKSPAELLSLLWIYPIFLFVFLFGFYGLTLWPNSISFLIGFFAWLSIYEIGYLENDALTIRKEVHPNIRISQGDIQFIQENFKSIIKGRILIFLFLVSVNGVLNLLPLNQLLLFIVIVLTSRFFFYLHNQIRSKLNILTYCMLCLTKYFVFPIVYLGMEYGYEPYWVILLTFPLLRTFEHAQKPKYQLKKLNRWAGSLDLFRVKYYAILLGVASLLFIVNGGPKALLFSISYFFLYRLAIILLISTKKYSREEES
jgi:hypothetical protein